MNKESIKVTKSQSGKAPGFVEMNVYQRIAHVQSLIGTVPMNGYNSHHKYKYATEADVMNALRPHLAEARLAVIPEYSDHNIEGNLTRIYGALTVVNIDNPEEIVKVTMWGEAMDGSKDSRGDKGFYKAYTGLLKYGLMKVFMVPTGDDPERTDGKENKTESQSDTVAKILVNINKLSGFAKFTEYETWWDGEKRQYSQVNQDKVDNAIAEKGIDIVGAIVDKTIEDVNSKKSIPDLDEYQKKWNSKKSIYSRYNIQSIEEAFVSRRALLNATPTNGKSSGAAQTSAPPGPGAYKNDHTPRTDTPPNEDY